MGWTHLGWDKQETCRVWMANLMKCNHLKDQHGDGIILKCIVNKWFWYALDKSGPVLGLMTSL
jgi:hypothetical protein